MKDIIDYINKNFPHHSHLDITLRVLTCLDYIEQNIEMIAAQVGKQSMLRHPDNNLAFHLHDYPTPDIARDQLLKLVGEVRGSFQSLMAIEDANVRQAVMSSFLNNINDSVVGCMEARLRSALTYFGLYQSSGCRHIDDLMREFFECHPNAEVVDVIAYFSAGVEYQLQLRDRHGDIKPLTWEWLKAYLRSVMDWQDIDTAWQSAAQTFVQPYVVKTRRWVIHQFKEQQHAERYLSYVKSMMPSFQAELAKAEVTFDSDRTLYFFRLTHGQSVAFQSLLREPVLPKDKEELPLEVVAQVPNQSLTQSSNLLLPASCKLNRSPTGFVVSLPSLGEAKEALTTIKTDIQHACPEIGFIQINHPSEQLYQFELTNKQWTMLQEQQRLKAGKIKLQSDFVIKSLRVDEKNYVRNFVEMITTPNKKHVLRTGEKKSFTVTGRGIYARKNTHSTVIKKKEPQYQPAEKQGFSKAQSTSYGFHGHHPMVFGFDKRRDKLVGVMIEVQNVLLSDRLYVYDGGTVGRPYDFDDEEEAKQYHQQKTGTVLFSHARLNDFKQALLSNRDKHNEALARLRWGDDHTSRFFVGGDSLEARLWAQDYVSIMQRHLVAQGVLQASEPLTICYYLPDNPALHLTLYTQAEQQLDRLEANAIYHDVTLRHHYYQQKNYDFLLALPVSGLAVLFNETHNNQNLILTILAEGYFHLVQSLIEKAQTGGLADLNQVLFNHLVGCSDDGLFKKIVSHCVEKYTSDFALSMLVGTRYDLLNKRDKNGRTALMVAAMNGRHAVVTAFLSYTGIGVNLQANDGATALIWAARNGHQAVVTALLSHPGIEVNLQVNDGATALMWAVRNGHQAVVTALLSHPGIEVNLEANGGATALMWAAMHGQHEVVTALLSHPGIELNLLSNNGWTALMLAARHGQHEVVTTLLSHPGLDVNLQNKNNKTAFTLAAINNHPKVCLAMISSGRYVKLTRRDFNYLLDLAANKAYAAEIQAALLNHYLPAYIKRRANQGDYQNWYGKLFGEGKDSKLVAAEALVRKDDVIKHKKALSGGDLGRVYEVIKKCRETLGQSYKPAGSNR